MKRHPIVPILLAFLASAALVHAQGAKTSAPKS
jgi:hypothetical protein